MAKAPACLVGGGLPSGSCAPIFTIPADSSTKLTFYRGYPLIFYVCHLHEGEERRGSSIGSNSRPAVDRDTGKWRWLRWWWRRRERERKRERKKERERERVRERESESEREREEVPGSLPLSLWLQSRASALQVPAPASSGDFTAHIWCSLTRPNHSFHVLDHHSHQFMSSARDASTAAVCGPAAPPPR